MAFRHTVGQASYVFDDLRSLLAKASPARAGDMLAGIAAASEEERVAARWALAELPLAPLLDGLQTLEVRRETSVSLDGGIPGSRMRSRYQVDISFTLEG